MFSEDSFRLGGTRCSIVRSRRSIAAGFVSGERVHRRLLLDNDGDVIFFSTTVCNISDNQISDGSL
ncbi:hypothetical protein M6B38_294285 [Iris pallida]|uniref:Uncharacterized protein n=1 Tax=Iris pallida TaxID=29817 RepID=A0AAX6HSI9_IRIPA|nr:hypothetical protein M6B38_294285 [Iris pallida]